MEPSLSQIHFTFQEVNTAVYQTHFIKLKSAGHDEEGELHGHRDDGTEGQVVGVARPDNHPHWSNY